MKRSLAPTAAGAMEQPKPKEKKPRATRAPRKPKDPAAPPKQRKPRAAPKAAARPRSAAGFGVQQQFYTARAPQQQQVCCEYENKNGGEALTASQATAVFGVDIPHISPSRHEDLECDCWSRFSADRNAPGCWLTPEYWSSAIFSTAPAPLREGACMRICDRSGRLAHLALANGNLGLDLAMLVDHPADPKGKPGVFVQHGYCIKCDRYEWFKLSEQKPATPIVWMSCSS